MFPQLDPLYLHPLHLLSLSLFEPVAYPELLYFSSFLVVVAVGESNIQSNFNTYIIGECKISHWITND